MEHDSKMNANETVLRIRTVDGEEHLFAMAGTTSNGTDYTVGTRLEKLLNQTNIALEVDGRLLILPMEQIRSIDISPLHSQLPEAVVPKVLVIHSSLTIYSLRV